MRIRIVLPAIAVAVLMALAGCAPSPFDSLDAEAQRLIARGQTDSLGPESTNDPHRVPRTLADRASDRDPYARRPDTANPPTAALPVGPDTRGPRDPDILPRMLDPVTDAIELDLEGSLNYAIAHSREYRNEKESLFLSALDLIAERHLWGPRFFDTVTARLSGTPEAGDHDQALELINQFRVTQRLPYGGQVSATALVNYVNALRQSSAQAGADRDSQSARVGVSLDLPLLRNAGQVAREDLIQAERNLVYAARRFERFRREFLVGISSEYFDLIRRQRAIENLERQVANLEWLRRRTEALADAGRVPFFEVQRAEQQVLFARNNMLNSQEGMASALDNFKIRLGMELDHALVIVPTEVVIPDPMLNIEASVETGLRLRLDLQTVRDQVDDARRRVRVAENRMLPDLDLFADVSLPTTRERRYAGLRLDAGDGQYNAGMRFDVPLDRRIELANYRGAVIGLERSQRSYTLQRDRVIQQIRQSVRRIEQARYTFELQNRNIEVARTRLRGVLLRLRDLGPRDFIEAQDDLLEAQNRRDAALRDLRVNILEYLLETGQMRVTEDGRWDAPARLTPEIRPAPMPAPEDLLDEADELQQQDGEVPPAAN